MERFLHSVGAAEVPCEVELACKRFFLWARANPTAKPTSHPQPPCFHHGKAFAFTPQRLSVPKFHIPKPTAPGPPLTRCDAFWISLMTDLESALRGQETTMNPTNLRSHSKASRFISLTCRGKRASRALPAALFSFPTGASSQLKHRQKRNRCSEMRRATPEHPQQL